MGKKNKIKVDGNIANYSFTEVDFKFNDCYSSMNCILIFKL